MLNRKTEHANNIKNPGIGLYIHVPFCKFKCFYCDFNSYSNINHLIKPYFNALKKEIRLYSDRLKDFHIDTVFIGGGTPSYVEYQLICELMDECRQYLDMSMVSEISIETNPGTLSVNKLTAYGQSGINRLSIGLQAWQNSLLGNIGRIHTQEEFVENYTLARNVGFKNVNIDIIFGLPGQTLADWYETLTNVINLKPDHVSCYSLKVEENTVFGRKYDEGKLVLMDDDMDREMYYMAVDTLSEAGLKHYEISNFAKPGYECKHNLIYWHAQEYIGLGAGAHSYFKGIRFNNVNDVNEYISLIINKETALENEYVIDRKEAMSEYIILSLRLTEGLNISDFKTKYGEDIMRLFGENIDRLIKRQLIKLDNNKIKLSKKGLDLANQVFMEFI